MWMRHILPVHSHVAPKVSPQLGEDSKATLLPNSATKVAGVQAHAALPVPTSMCAWRSEDPQLLPGQNLDRVARGATAEPLPVPPLCDHLAQRLEPPKPFSEEKALMGAAEAEARGTTRGDHPEFYKESRSRRKSFDLKQQLTGEFATILEQNSFMTKNEYLEDKNPKLYHGSPLAKFVHGVVFRFTISSLILVNSICIGWQANDAILVSLGREPTAEETTWEHIEMFFASCFAIELVLRIVTTGKSFWLGPERGWNLLDALLVLQSLVDLVSHLSGGNGTPNFSFGRTLRLMRFSRILRVIRVMRFFQSFRLMVYSIVYSMTSLLWVFLLLLFVIYSFALFFLHGITDYVEASDSTGDNAVLEDINKLYGSVPDTLLSLFMGICGGVDWAELMLPLKSINVIYQLVFIFYIYFVVFGVLNVVTSLFVDSVYQVSKQDRDIVVQDELTRNKMYAHNIQMFFYEADKDSSGMLSWEEFEAHLADERVKAYFATLQLDTSQARALFMLLDVDETNAVEIDEFVGGCMRLKGDAKSIDVNMLLYENEKMICKWQRFMDVVEVKFHNIERALNISSNSPRKSGVKNSDPISCLPQGSLSSTYTPRSEDGSGYNRLDHAANIIAGAW